MSLKLSFSMLRSLQCIRYIFLSIFVRFFWMGEAKTIWTCAEPRKVWCFSRKSMHLKQIISISTSAHQRHLSPTSPEVQFASLGAIWWSMPTYSCSSIASRPNWTKTDSKPHLAHIISKIYRFACQMVIYMSY